MKKYTFAILGAALLVAFMASTGLMTKAVEAAQAICTTEVVVPADVVADRSFSDNTPLPEGTRWVEFNRDAGSGDFVTGPGTPPSGVGSFATVTPGNNDKVTLFNYEHIGTQLADINQLGYSTYRDAASTATAVQVPSINLQVDFNGPDVAGGFTTLVFEPVYNLAQGPVVPGVWQTWDAYNGGTAVWWSTSPLPGGICAFDCFVTWDAIVAANPDAVIVGGFGVNQGGGNAGLTAASDNLTIGYGDICITYDFEPFEVATDKDACKDGGWRNLTDDEGNSFRNQGQCVSFVASGGKSGGKKK